MPSCITLRSQSPSKKFAQSRCDWKRFAKKRAQKHNKRSRSRHDLCARTSKYVIKSKRIQTNNPRIRKLCRACKWAIMFRKFKINYHNPEPCIRNRIIAAVSSSDVLKMKLRASKTARKASPHCGPSFCSGSMHCIVFYTRSHFAGSKTLSKHGFIFRSEISASETQKSDPKNR